MPVRQWQKIQKLLPEVQLITISQPDNKVQKPGFDLATGLLQFSKPLFSILEDFMADFNLQVLGAVKVIQALLPRLKQSDLASVVLFSTVAVKVGFNFHSLVIRRQLEGIFNYREKALEKIFGKGDVHSLL